MKVFLDANILVSVLNKEYPLFPFTARIASLASNSRFAIYTSPLCLAIAFYFAEKKHSSALAKQKIDTLCQYIQIAPNLAEGVIRALQNKQITDLEDGLEYYAASNAGCECIVTEDKSDFWFSDIEVLNSMTFFEKYVAKRA